MFFQNLILSINENDRVLEVGPGATPFHRSDVFLELEYDNEKERIAQSGHVGILKSEKPIFYYNGEVFPFKDNEFDYIICSHVLEHVNNVQQFLSEIQRVSKKGYLEFPTVYYDYLYNFPEHINFLFYRDGVINWMTKEESGLSKFESIQKFFYRTAQLQYFDLINSCKDYFFQGFEWENEIVSKKVDTIDNLTYKLNEIYLAVKTGIPSLNYNEISLKNHIRYKLKKKIKGIFKLNTIL